MSQEHKDVTSVWQVVKFTLFSISAGLIQVAAFTLMETVFHLPYWPSYLTALVLSVLWNFTFNRRYTFRSDASVGRSMLLVALFYAVFTPVSTWWGHVLTTAGWNDCQFCHGISLSALRGLSQPHRYQRRSAPRQ